MKKLLKKIIIGSPFETTARRFYAWYKGDYISSLNQIYDRQTISVMKRYLKKNYNCIDIGCHKGRILRYMIKFAPNGIHYAFEPLPMLYRELINSYHNVKIYELALSDTVGETSFQYVVSNPGYSGLRKRMYERPEEHIEEIRVMTDILDNIIPYDLNVHFIKIDVEGAELQVLRGSIMTIKNNMPIIVFEHGAGGANYYGTTPDDVYDLLTKECDLRISLMNNWLRNENSLSRQEFIDQFYQHINYYFIAHP
jgi:FkbM family methyltransferase